MNPSEEKIILDVLETKAGSRLRAKKTEVEATRTEVERRMKGADVSQEDCEDRRWRQMIFKEKSQNTKEV